MDQWTRKLLIPSRSLNVLSYTDFSFCFFVKFRTKLRLAQRRSMKAVWIIQMCATKRRELTRYKSVKISWRRLKKRPFHAMTSLSRMVALFWKTLYEDLLLWKNTAYFNRMRLIYHDLFIFFHVAEYLFCFSLLSSIIFLSLFILLCDGAAKKVAKRTIIDNQLSSRCRIF